MAALSPLGWAGTVALVCMLGLACDRAQEPRPGGSQEPATVEASPPVAPPPKPATMTAKSPITLEDIATYPLPGTSLPGSLAFSPDDRWLTWLDSPDDTLVRELYAKDLQSGEVVHAVEPPGGGESEENLSPEEKLARERLRQRALGVTRYAWAKQGDRMMIPLSGEVWVKGGETGAVASELRKLVGKDAQGRPVLDPKLSPDGQQIAYVQGDELWVVPFDGSAAPKQLTKGGAEQGLVRGLAEYIAAEEMDRHDGLWWSPDSQFLAFTEVDERGLVDYRIVHQGKDEVGGLAQEDHRYPFAGTRNAKVRLGVVPARGGAMRFVDLSQPDWAARSQAREGSAAWTDDPDGDYYLARVHWMPDNTLLAEVEDRRQLELRLLAFADAGKSPARELLRETSEVWINLHHDFRALEFEPASVGRPAHAGAGAAAHPEQVGGFVWASEKTGYRHLYLHGADGRELHAITSGEWMVDGIVAIDETKQKLWFMAGKDDPRQRHLFEVGLDGKDLRQITTEPGSHGVALDHAHERFVDVHSSREQPPSIRLRSLADGSVIEVLHDERDPAIAKLGLEPPELVELSAADGTTKLYGAIYRPDPAVHGPGPHPTVVSVYGGPHAQRVDDSWGMSVDLRAQYLRDHGYLVFKLDNRGSARRGLAFEAALRHDMGNVEVQDQVAGVKWLVAQGLSDPNRVAIYGWSYGGYMAAMALARAPETFAVGIAGAPVSHWDGYDTHYTERYMGLPQENPEGYRNASVMAHVEGIRGKLLLVHGLIDENVHFRHSARLINALIAAGKTYDLQLYPDERHMPRKLADRVYMERRIFDYLSANL
jgi:dipeptidyl-peptidase-4